MVTHPRNGQQADADYRARLESALEHWLPPEDEEPVILHRAMRYAVLGNGKRIRPLLVYATGNVLNLEPGRLDAAACAVELIHAYSLVHDDLPAMDDDDLRRGRPTVHKAFDEATAILVGDALQSLAFYVLAADPFVDDARVHRRRCATLAMAAGSLGMAGGQSFDMAAEGRSLSLEELERLHQHKTGALLRACVRLACDSSPDPVDEQREALDRFAHCMGLAFQIRDDILDIEASTEVLGKAQGADTARDKATYPALLGLDEAKRRAEHLHRQAIAALAPFGAAAEPLERLAAYIIERDR